MSLRLPGFAAALVAAGLTLSAFPAAAAPVTISGTVTATGFSEPPVDPVVISFLLNFDNAVDISNQSSGLTITSANISWLPSAVFSYIAGGDVIEVGANSSVNGMEDSTNDFYFVLNNASATPTGFLFNYQTANGYSGSAESVSFVSDVPEPASLVILGAGLTGLGAAVRRRRRG